MFNHIKSVLVAATCLAGVVVSPFAYSQVAAPVVPDKGGRTFTFDEKSPPAIGKAPSEPFTPGQAYDAARGYGFVSTPNGNEQAFSIRAAPGDYRVTVTVGSRTAATRATIWAEDRRLMAAPLEVKKGEYYDVTFVVNVRDPYLNKAETDFVNGPKVGLRGDDLVGRTWDDQLTVAVSGATGHFAAIKVEKVETRRVFLAGDSTVTDQGGSDFASWGQMLPRMLSPEVSIANHARSGETMKSFMTSLRWDKLLSEVRPGDIVIIQFGHNDEKKQWPRTYAAPETTYPAYLTAFALDVKDRGGLPVVVTPVARRWFKDGRIENTHLGYDAAVRTVAEKLGIPLIDLTAQTTTMYETMGDVISPLAFGNGGADKTHHNAYGAWHIACYAANTLISTPSLWLKSADDRPVCDPANPADPLNWELTPADWPLMRKPEAPKQGLEVTPVR